VFVYNDYLFWGTSKQFWLLVGLRLLFVASVVTFIYLSEELTGPIHYEQAALAIALLGVLLVLYVNSTRPSWYTSITIEWLLTLGFYWFLPGNSGSRALPAFVLFVGTLCVSFWYKTGIPPQEQFLFLMSQIAANLAGIVTSAHATNSRRHRFIAEVTLEETRGD
jgi:hypothetical protein